MDKGKGTLTKLKQLKAEHREAFKATAPRVKKLDLPCYEIRCSTAMQPSRLKFTWRGLRVVRGTCTRKTCPLVTLETYLEVLERTRPFRQHNEDADSRAFWWGVVADWKRRFQRERET